MPLSPTAQKLRDALTAMGVSGNTQLTGPVPKAPTALPAGGEYGAAGRGENPENAAYYEASAKLGIPASAAETVTNTKKGRDLVTQIQTRNGFSSTPTAAATPAASKTSTASRYSAASGTRGLTTTSSGGIYGSAGRDTLTTKVDRTAGVPGNLLDEYMSYLSPQSVLDRQKQARRELERERQSQLDAIRTKYSSQVVTEQQAGTEDLARQRSMNLRAGLGGSDFGAANKIAVRDRTNKNIQAIEANQDIEIGNVLNDIEQLAQSRVQQEQQALQQGFSNMFQYQQYTGQQQQQQRAQAVESIAQLGKSGLDLPTIREKDPQLYESLAQASGMSDIELEAVLNNNKPQAAKIDYQYKVSGGKLIAFGVDPQTGQMKVLEQEVDIPDDYDISTMPNGTVLAIPKEWDGDPSKIKTVGNYAKSTAAGGVSGSNLTPLAQSIYDNPALLSNLTPTEKGKVLKELAAKGLDLANFATEKVTAAQREQIAGFDDLIREANNASELLQTTQLNTGPLASRVKKIGAAVGFQRDFTEYRSVIDNFGSALLKLRSGAAVTPQEFTRIAGFIPAVTDDERTAQTKINRFIEEMTKAQQNYVTRSTQTTQQIQQSVAPSTNEVEVRSPNGTVGTIPASQLQQALKEGYTQM